MQDLALQEQFEIEVLECLNSKKLLRPLVLGGGTMLRLCYGLNRFSVDLDFWIAQEIDNAEFFRECKDVLSRDYALTDSANKFYTLLFEIRSKDYPRSLKIEIRKEKKTFSTEQTIAFSKYASTQVLLNTVSLKDMMAAKVGALLERKEIRDAFDLEFLLKKGVSLDVSPDIKKKALNVIEGFKTNDYKVKLGSLLEPKERQYYIQRNFIILKQALV